MRRSWVTVAVAIAVPFGCTLLDPYPGGESPAAVLNGGVGEGTFDQGSLQEPLVDPAIDDTISVTRNLTEVLAHPGDAFPIDLTFDAENMNVVGGGIQFPGSNEVQWTFIEGLKGETLGDIRFGFVVDNDVCGEVPNLCHELKTQQFAVAENTRGDVDGDGEDDGQFVVSPPVEVNVVLICATCESPSCLEVLPPGECQQCGQASECSDYFAMCLDPAMFPEVTDEDVGLFNAVFGPNGALWSTNDGCALGENLCEGALSDVEEMCRLGGGGEMAMTGTDGGGSDDGGSDGGGSGG